MTKNSNTVLITLTLLTNHEETFTGDSHRAWAFVGGPVTSPNKSNTADSGHIEF